MQYHATRVSLLIGHWKMNSHSQWKLEDGERKGEIGF